MKQDLLGRAYLLLLSPSGHFLHGPPAALRSLNWAGDAARECYLPGINAALDLSSSTEKWTTKVTAFGSGWSNPRTHLLKLIWPSGLLNQLSFQLMTCSFCHYQLLRKIKSERRDCHHLIKKHKDELDPVAQTCNPSTLGCRSRKIKSLSLDRATWWHPGWG